MNLHDALTTTRSVRKRLDFDRPVELSTVKKCLELALQAPTGSNMQGWHFMVITDQKAKDIVADAYRRGFEFYAKHMVTAQPSFGAEDPRTQSKDRVVTSAVYLAENIHRAPVLVIPCIQGRVETAGQLSQASQYGSILPAAWSFQLALRAEGMGTCWTTLHLFHEKEVAQALGIPDDFTQACLFPVAYTKGTDFKPASRLPLSQVVSLNSWGTPLE